MSADRDMTRIVRSWLDEGVTVLPDRVLDAVLDQLPATHQRRAFWSVRRFSIMNTNIARLAVGALALVIVAIVGIKVVAGPNVGSPSPTPALTPSPTPQTIPFVNPYTQPGTPIAPGTYRITGQASEAMVAALPAGCLSNSYARGGGVYRTDGPVDTGTNRVASLSISSVGTLLADGCSETGVQPPIGPTVDDLMVALNALPVVEISAPTGITLDGYQGKQIDLTYHGGLAGSSCDPQFFELWMTPPVAGETWGVYIDRGWQAAVRVLDVGGRRWIVITSYRLDASDELKHELRQIVNSIRIEPAT